MELNNRRSTQPAASHARSASRVPLVLLAATCGAEPGGVQNQQQSGIIQIYYGIIVNVYICDNNDENDPEPIQLYLADGRNNPRAIEFSKTVQLTKVSLKHPNYLVIRT